MNEPVQPADSKDLGPAAGPLYPHQRNPNVLYLWDAWRLCRANNLPVPEEVLNYLDEVAAALLAPLKQAEPRPLKRVGTFLRKALRFQGGHGPPAEYQSYWMVERYIRMGDLAEAVLRENPSVSKAQAYGHVATQFLGRRLSKKTNDEAIQESCDEKTVERAHAAYRKLSEPPSNSS